MNRHIFLDKGFKDSAISNSEGMPRI
jgi:hypothetical protein